MFDYISELQCVERVFVTNYEATTTYIYSIETKI